MGLDAGRLVGYASVFGPLSEDLGGFRERIAPGAFNRTLHNKSSDVRALVNHDSTMVLGRRQNDTLQLSVDSTGLKVTINPPSTSYAADLMELVKRGDVSQMSFGFIVTPGGESWNVEDGVKIRTVSDLELLEVSVVSIPAYPDTTVAVRGLGLWESDRLQKRLQNRGNRITLLHLMVPGG
jgi:HK97 family phage prohead protease